MSPSRRGYTRPHPSRHAGHHPSQVKPEYDVIVVGSGAAGGQTAYALTMEGAKVLMIEAAAITIR
ncbi:MAG: FAD-dependent monooxygenase [Lacunisphaera sp.]